MAMRIPSSDYEWREFDPGVTDKEFFKRRDVAEGIVGRDRILTRFENTQRTQVLAPRSDFNRAAPRDARFPFADNHGEWGQDKFHERLEKGVDVFDQGKPYFGMGLPTREDLRDPVNMNSVSEVGLNPTADGIDGDM